MSGVTREQVAPRPVSCVSLNDVEVVAGFSSLESLLRRGLGGGGGSAVSSETGLLTVTASSERLLAALPAPRPPLALLTAAVRHQTDVWKDGGLATGALLAGLLARLLRASGPRHRVRAALREVAAECRRLAAAQQLRLQLEVPQLLAVVDTVLRSKRLLALTAAERRHLSLQLLRAFLLVVPAEPVGDRAALGHVHVQLVPSGELLDSAPVPALLVPEPALDDYPPAAGRGRRRCLLFTPHLGEHGEEALDGMEMSLSAEMSTRPLSAERWQAALMRLPLRSGDVIACQRTVPLSLRRALAGRGVTVLERLGSRGASLLTRLSGARPLAGVSLLSEVAAELSAEDGGPAELVGRLHAVVVRTLGGRPYAELRRADSPVVTLLVHCAHPEPLRDELERQLESALFALCCLLGEPAVVPGGGCLEVVLLGQLAQLAAGQDRVTRAVTDALCDTLRQNALAIAGSPLLYRDDSYGHGWRTEPETSSAADHSCVCGLVSGADLRGRLQFSELTPSYLCEGTAGPPVATPAPLDPAEISEECLVDCGRVRLGVMASALEACHAILGIGTCVIEKT
ncbi:McKusick-Kaufman/Bardet-Biedl syndromes putative chaperonin-like [Amphibalanus amphitrite]|uniref:McKusick-Kaufman/Bardet-Biedl syndromes putative chaperonin-like n=1 Tax=Amphibalanus amphitrite TaxID=1232801 RepID=UPI001C905398|nr:McKusick-Kaufman/Bardet-Biedl syndromes putative chaperonin-like [Amphibalanus amphitrite]